MTHISKKILPQTHRAALLQQLVAMLQKGSLQKGEAILTELLTDSEQVMLIKRLGAIVMLDQGVSQYRVAQMLQLSTQTVRRYKHGFASGQYSSMCKQITSKSFDTKKFLDVLEKLLLAGMPPRTKDRWKHVPGFGG